MVKELAGAGLALADPEILNSSNSKSKSLKYNGVESYVDENFYVEHMSRYTQLLCSQFLKMVNKTSLKTVDSPGLASLNVERYLEPSNLLETTLTYDPHSVIAGALYLSRLCRPDIAYSVSWLCRQVHAWSSGADLQLERLISYLNTTSNLGIHNPRPPVSGINIGREVIEFLSDADLGGDLLSSRSSGGDVCYLNYELKDGSRQRWLVSWASKMLSQKATSTPWSECAAHHRGLCDRALPLSLFLENVQEFQCPIWGNCDNSPIISAIKHGYSVAMRHFARHSRLSLVHLRDVYLHKGSKLSYIDTLLNTSDITTKHLNSVLHWQHVGGLLLREMH